MNSQPHLNLTAAERKALKARAHHLNPTVTIGDAGLSAAVVAEAERAIVVHELIKVRVLGDDRAVRTELMGRLCDALGAAPVQMIGKLLVLWRPKPAVDPRDSGPHLPKKIAGSGGRTTSTARPKARPTGGRATAAKPAGGRAAAAKPARTEGGFRGGKPARSRSAEDATGGGWKRPARGAPKSADTDRESSGGRTGRGTGSAQAGRPSRGGGRDQPAGRAAGARTTTPRRPSTRTGAPAAKRATAAPRGRKR